VLDASVQSDLFDEDPPSASQVGPSDMNFFAGPVESQGMYQGICWTDRCAVMSHALLNPPCDDLWPGPDGPCEAHQARSVAGAILHGHARAMAELGEEPFLFIYRLVTSPGDIIDRLDPSMIVRSVSQSLAELGTALDESDWEQLSYASTHTLCAGVALDAGIERGCSGRVVARSTCTKAGSSAGVKLVHLTPAASKDAILRTGLGAPGGVPGDVYAIPAQHAHLRGVKLMLRTGLNPFIEYLPIDIPACAEKHFYRPTPVGPFSAWQWMSGQRVSSSRILIELRSQTVITGGWNRSQFRTYVLDGGIDATVSETIRLAKPQPAPTPRSHEMDASQQGRATNGEPARRSGQGRGV
jgi:hypothetical protein